MLQCLESRRHGRCSGVYPLYILYAGAFAFYRLERRRRRMCARSLTEGGVAPLFGHVPAAAAAALGGTRSISARQKRRVSRTLTSSTPLNALSAVYTRIGHCSVIIVMV